jgi:hypothetical protein
LPLKQPRVRDKREQKEVFTSTILPRYLRRIPLLDKLVPHVIKGAKFVDGELMEKAA